MFAAIIPVAPATGASINPARTVGPMLVQQIAGGTVKWEQLPVYLLAELLAGVARRPGLRFIAHTPADRAAAAGIDLADPERRDPQPGPGLTRPAPTREETTMKKLINDPNDVVVEALLGIEAAHPDLRVDHHNKIIYRGDAPRPGKVGIISGGGSGHEPLHGGFVGLGHARRGLRRRGVHLAGARPDARRHQAASTAAPASCTS